MDDILSQIDNILQDVNISEDIYDLSNQENIKTYNIIKKNVSFKPITVDMDIDDLNVNDTKDICKKETRKHFDDITTTVFFTENDKDNIFRFQYLVNNLFNKMIKKIIEELNTNTPLGKKKLKDTDIIFLYKGGTTLKIIYEKYKDIFENTDNNVFFEDLKSYFKRSDSDYVIMINPYIDVRLDYYYSFEYIYALICYHTTNLLNKIRNFIKTTSISEKIIKRSNFTPDILIETGTKLNETIGKIKMNPIKRQICSEYNNFGDILGIAYFTSNDVVQYYPPHIVFTDNEKQDIKNSLCGHISIITSDDFIYNEVHSDLYDINLSINNNVNIKTGKNIASFCLQRLKINFVAIFNNLNERNKILKPYSGELIDIVIFKKESTALQYFYNNLDDEYTRYTYTHLNTTLKFQSYSINGHLYDLIYILFGMSEYPWNDNKYTNRINRMVLFIILNFYESYKNVDEFSKNFKNFTKSILEIIINIDELNKKLKDEFSEFRDDKTFSLILDVSVGNKQFKIPFEDCKRKNNKILELLRTTIDINNIQILIEELIILNNKIQYYSEINNLKILLTNLLNKINLFKYNKIYNIDTLTKKREFMSLDGSKIKQLGGYKQKYLKYKQKYMNLKKIQHVFVD